MSYAKKNKKPIFVSTQILTYVTQYFIPSRPSILDLTNILLDGASGIILCHEISKDERPAYTISVAKKIINEVKKETENTYE